MVSMRRTEVYARLCCLLRAARTRLPIKFTAQIIPIIYIFDFGLLKARLFNMPRARGGGRGRDRDGRGGHRHNGRDYGRRRQRIEPYRMDRRRNERRRDELDEFGRPIRRREFFNAEQCRI